MGRGWGSSLQAVGHAAGDLLRAELEALADDLRRTGRRLGGALLLLAGALFTLFWVLGLALYVAIEVVHRWLPRWAAAAVVLGVALLVLAALAALGWQRLRRLEAPTATVRRRWRSHRRWWHEQFPPPEGDEPIGVSGPRRAPDSSAEE